MINSTQKCNDIIYNRADMSLKTSSKWFCLLIIFLLIKSSFCLKLALLILSLVTQWLMSVCIPLAKTLVAWMYFWTSSARIFQSFAIPPQKSEPKKSSTLSARFLQKLPTQPTSNFFIRSPATSFLPTSTSFVKEPTIGFSASNE